MDISVAPGTYVVAVSGGVDSMALLDMLIKLVQADVPEPPRLDAAQGSKEEQTNRTDGTESERQTQADTAMRQETGQAAGSANSQDQAARGYRLIVAHYDHGIRHDSHIDREIVQAAARKHGLPFVYDEGRLGPGASEDLARQSRYEFLHAVRNASGARAVITAHHHDDLLETAVINLLRGTNRKGLSSLRSTNTVHRPLLHIQKHQLRQYAQDQGLVWREDQTNFDTKYLRNHVRHNILSKFAPEHKQQLIDIVKNTSSVNDELEQQLTHYLHLQPGMDKLSRGDFVRLPHLVAREVIAEWLRRHGIRDFDKKTIERIVIQAKTLPPGKSIDVVKGYVIQVGKANLVLVKDAPVGTRGVRPLA